MRILVTGANGQVGRSMLDLNGQDGHEIIGLSREQFDLTKPEDFDRVIDRIEPDAILNAAAYTAVDKAEDESELAYQVNAVAPAVMATVARKSGLRFIHLSTDYVFDGKKGSPYTEKDQPNPLNTYGSSKLRGELGVLENYSDATIVRTAWLFSAFSRNFLKTMLSLLDHGKELHIVNDQIGSPTSANGLATRCMKLFTAEQLPNILHCAGKEAMSWFHFAKLIEELYSDDSKPLQVKPCLSSEYVTKANRPRDTRLITLELPDNFTELESLSQTILSVINLIKATKDE